MKVVAFYVAKFDGDITLKLSCEYDDETKVVSDIRPLDTYNSYTYNSYSLEDEYVELDDGTQLRSEDGVSFANFSNQKAHAF